MKHDVQTVSVVVSKATAVSAYVACSWFSGPYAAKATRAIFPHFYNFFIREQESGLVANFNHYFFYIPLEERLSKEAYDFAYTYSFSILMMLPLFFIALGQAFSTMKNLFTPTTKPLYLTRGTQTDLIETDEIDRLNLKSNASLDKVPLMGECEEQFNIEVNKQVNKDKRSPKPRLFVNF